VALIERRASHSLPQGPAGGERRHFLGAAEGVRIQRAMPLARIHQFPTANARRPRKFGNGSRLARRNDGALNRAALCGAATAPIPPYQ